MASMPKCRGFTHPVILLIRSSVQPCARSQPPSFSSSRPVTSPVSLPPAPGRLATRLLSTSRTRAAQAVKTGVPRPTAAPRPPAGAGSYARLLAQAKHGTVLYEAAPQKVFLASSYAAALFCVGGGVVNMYFNVYNPPAGTADCKQNPAFFTTPFSVNNSRHTSGFLFFRRYSLRVLRNMLLDHLLENTDSG